MTNKVDVDFLAQPEVVSPSPWYTHAMEQLVDVVQALSQARDVQAIMHVVRDAARNLTGADGSTFVLRDGGQCYYADENAIEPLWKGKRFPMEACISGWVMLNAQPALIEDIYADPRIPAEAYRPTFVKSLAMVPIRRQSPVGAIGNYWARPHRPRQDEVAILQALADTTAVALENAGLYEELRQKVQTLEDQQRRIAAQHETLEVFTRALAHDLKEPVRTVRAFSDLIVRNEETAEDRATYVNFIRQASERMAMLVDTVFLYTQLDDPSRMTKKTCAMDAVLTAARDNLRQLILEHGATVTGDGLPDVQAHPGHMMQVLQNLVANAIKHTPGKAAIKVSALDAGDAWQIHVRDNGPGIARDDLERIFQPFKRLGQNEEGAGLGLAICAKIVNLHGGRIWCESEPGKGADFIFTLPKAVAVAETPPAVKSTQVPDSSIRMRSPIPPAEKGLANVLLVDDREADIELARVFLQVRDKLQCNLTVARGGQQALDVLRQARSQGEEVDLILLDINMPGMSGFEMLEQMHLDEELRQTAVVMCTGSTYDKDQQRARGLGAAGYMVKPASLEQLAPMLATIPALQLLKDGEASRLLRAA